MLLGMDSFDYFGVTESFMLEGLWSEIVTASAGWNLSTTNPRTGTHCLNMGGATGGRVLRRQFGAAKTVVGIGYAIFMANMPTANDRMILFEFRDAANAAQCCAVLQTTGAIAVKRGTSSGVTLDTSVTLMQASAYNHVEMWVTISNTVGTIEVRLNGVTIINLTGQDTQNTALAETSQFMIGSAVAGGTGASCDIDDIFFADNSGSQNNTFLGDQKVYTVFPDADTDEADWVPLTGVQGFAMIDEADPDNDTTYVQSGTIAESGQNVSQYGLGDLPSDVSAISAVYCIGRQRKTDAGTADTMQSMVSGSFVDDGTPIPITTAYTYWPEVFELDPATGAPWTRTSFNAANYRITRTA
jgi:hypothetical protein